LQKGEGKKTIKEEISKGDTLIASLSEKSRQELAQNGPEIRKGGPGLLKRALYQGTMLEPGSMPEEIKQFKKKGGLLRPCITRGKVEDTKMGGEGCRNTTKEKGNKRLGE